jgi:hypothetical protein
MRDAAFEAKHGRFYKEVRGLGQEKCCSDTEKGTDKAELAESNE